MFSQSVIFCGGLGTRLGELTATTPKPMLPIGGRPFLDILIQEAARFGFDEILLLAGRFGTQIAEAYDGKTCFGARLKVLVEPEPLGTGGALRFAAAHLAPFFMVMNGDSWIDANLRAFAARWPGGDTLAQMLLQPVEDAGRFGTVEALNGRAICFREKDSAHAGRPGLINSGVYLFDRRILELLPAEGPASLEHDLLVPLVASGRVATVAAEPGAYFVDIGVPSSYAAAQEELPRVRTRPALFLDRDGTLNRDKGYTHRPEDLIWMPGAQTAIAKANRLGWYVFVVSNQSGVARGFYSAEAVRAFHRAMLNDLAIQGAHIDALAFCPHHPDGKVAMYAQDCACRKPQPGLITDLLSEWKIDARRSIMVGDKPSDIAAAEAAGIRGVLFDGSDLLATIAPYLI